MSTFGEHEAVLRRALMAAAEQVEPSHDGLERIQARLEPPRPFLIAWLQGIWTDLILRAPEGVQSLVYRLIRAVQPLRERMGPLTERIGPLSERIGPLWKRIGPQRTADGGRRPMGWLRPVAAMSVAVFVIGAGAYVAFSDSTLLGAPAGSSSSNNQGQGGGTGGGTAPSSGSSLNGTGSSAPSSWPTSVSPSASPCPSGSHAAFQSPPSSSPPPSPSTSPASPTPTPTPSDSSSASPDPTDSAGQSGPSTGPGSDGRIGTTAYVQLALPGSSACKASTKTSRKRAHGSVHAMPGTTMAVFGITRRNAAID